MNRWILRGLTVAGFTAGAWLLGNAAAYAADTSADTTTTVTVEVHLGTLTPSTASNVNSTIAAPAVRLTATTPVTTAVSVQLAVHAHTAFVATTSTTTPVATDSGLSACVDVALNTAGSGCGQPAGTVGDSTAADAAISAAAGIGVGSDGSGTVTGTTTIDNSGSTTDAVPVRNPSAGNGTGATEAGSDAVPAGTTSPVDAGSSLASADTVQVNGSRAILDGLGGTLPTTGGDLWRLLGIAAALLLLGVALRRRTT